MMYNVCDLALPKSDLGKAASGSKIFAEAFECILEHVSGTAPFADLEIQFAETHEQFAVIGRSAFRQTKGGKGTTFELIVTLDTGKRMQAAGKFEQQPRIHWAHDQSTANGFEGLQQMTRQPQLIRQAL